MSILSYLKKICKDEENLKNIHFLWNRIVSGNYDFEAETAEQFVLRGVAKFYHNELENALQDFDKALTLNSESDFALYSRGLTHQFLGDIDQAILDIEKAVLINPTGEYYDGLGGAYSENGAMEKALHAHKKATLLTPDEPIFWYNYGFELVEAGYLDEGIEMFDKAIELDPDYQDAIVNRKHVVDRMSGE